MDKCTILGDGISKRVTMKPAKRGKGGKGGDGDKVS